MSQDKSYRIPDDVRTMCLKLATSLSRNHGNYYITDEQMKRAEKLSDEIKEINDAELLALDTFEGLDWIEKWQNNTLSEKERKYIQNHKKEYIAIFIKRAKTNFQKAQTELQRARAEIDFWSGKTMSPIEKEILYELPF